MPAVQKETTPEQGEPPMNMDPRLFTRALVFISTLLAMVTTGCLKLRQPPTPPPPTYMDTTDRFVLFDTPSTQKPNAVFYLNNKPFCFAGTNNYYLTYKSRAMVDDVMKKAADQGLSVIRVWGFVDRGSLDLSVGHVDMGYPGDGTKDGVYFQYWDKENNRPAYNEGANGLTRLDYVISAAKAQNIKVIITLTNNWHEFGGMDQYLLWYNIKSHYRFYTDQKVKTAYKNWVSFLIGRTNSVDGTLYRDDPAIFAWELANEPRAMNGSEFDDFEGWDTGTLVSWAKEMSAYIKSLDPNHLVAVGDEGFINGDKSHWAYSAHDGVDHKALCAVKSIDFCTFHLYPDDWGTGYKFGYDWIRKHVAIARELNKPTIMEEYGVHVKRDDKTLKIKWGWERRKTAYQNWLNLFYNLGGNGALFWMLAGIDDQTGNLYPDYDHYTVYPDMPTANLLKAHTDVFNNSAPVCTLWPKTEPSVQTPFVQVKRVALDKTKQQQ